ncbi:Ig-like domain-containing protein, partial [Arenibacter echinorum]
MKINTLYNIFSKLLISRYLRSLTFLCAFLLLGFNGFGQSTVDILGEPATVNTIAEYTVTVVFSEGVNGFDQSDVVVVNGSVTTFIPLSFSDYSVGITPSGAQGNITIDIPEDAATAILGGAGNTAAAQATTLFDNIQPSVVISSAVGSPTNTNPIPITITFSEAVTGFVLGDIGVTNGTAGNFGGTGTTYTADITPGGNGTVTINVAAGVALDGAGNGNTAATPYSRVYDVTQPSVVISSAVGSPTNTNPIPITITFSEAVTGFV